MSESIPVFTQRPIPRERDQWGDLELPLAKWPRCSCGEAGPIDDATGLCRACWRTGPWSAAFLEERDMGAAIREELRVLRRAYEMALDLIKAVAPDEFVRIGILFPPDEVGAYREAREVPRLTDEAVPAGVSLDVALVPQPKSGPPRRRT